MSNENKKAWINLIIPGIFFILIFIVELPSILNNIFGFIIIFVILTIIQFYLNKYLNKKYPSSKDLKD